MSVRTDTRNDESLIQPPQDFIPPCVTPQEAKWLEKVLELDFKGRDIVLRQISASKISREVDSESLEIFFNYEGDDLMLDRSGAYIASISSYREVGAHANADLYSFEGKVDSLYIYMPDKSDLNLFPTSFDDVGHEVAQYLRDACDEVTGDFVASGAADAAELGEYLEERAERNKSAVARFLQGISEKLGGHIEQGIGPLSSAVHVPLGSMGGSDYEAIALCSRVGKYFLAYAHKNGCMPQRIDDCFPRYTENYPGGITMERLRRMLYDAGYKPLRSPQVRYELTLAGRGDVECCRVRLLDALFTGRGLLARRFELV